jgi:hypothetical protein
MVVSLVRRINFYRRAFLSEPGEAEISKSRTVRTIEALPLLRPRAQSYSCQAV